MNRQRFMPLLGLAFAMFFLAASAQADLYWVAFNGTGGVYKFVMGIDENGNIVKAPKAVLFWDQIALGNADPNGEPQNPFGEDSIYGPNGGPTALALMDKDASQFYLYMVNGQGSIMRMIINKSTLTPSNAVPTILFKGPPDGAEFFLNDFRTLQATQHTSKDWLGSIFGPYDVQPGNNPDSVKGRCYAFDLDAKGKLTGTSNRITPRTADRDQECSISPDGLIAVTNVEKHPEGVVACCTTFIYNDNNNEEHIYAQVLNGNHLPVDDPEIVGVSGPQTSSVDVSNLLSGNRRFVVYNTRSLDTPDTSNGDDLVLQVIDGTTAQKIAAPKTLQSDQEMTMGQWQTIAVDPDGRFVLFTKRPLKSTPPGTDDTLQGTLTQGNRDSLYYLKLDANGNASGSPKLLYSADQGPQTGAVDEVNDSVNGGDCDECAWPQINLIDILKD